MGVHGLTTYLRENKQTLSRTLLLSSPHPLSSPQRIPLVVDGWSFIYEVIYCADLPWVYGGEYSYFARLIEHAVRAWISLGLQLHFVFDGPYPVLKFPTLVSRITRTNIQSGLLFFRTSVAARSSARFLHETTMLPSLAFSVCVDTLLRLTDHFRSLQESEEASASLQVHFADEEGDPYAVALAGRLNAYVAGRDSDFVVLNAEGYRGYVPLDEMVWTLATSASSWDGEGSVYSASVADTESVSGFGDGEADDDGFQTVRKGKARKKRATTSQTQTVGRGILPPDSLASVPTDEQFTLSFVVYTPSALATHLGIPVSLLPLLGALLGNDFTGASASEDSGPPPATTADIRSKARANLQRLFFERQLTLAQRITRVASTLSGLLATALGSSGGAAAAAGGKKRGKRVIGSVMELIDAAVTALLVRPLDTFATGEREAVVERVVEATLQYAIPKAENEEGDGVNLDEVAGAGAGAEGLRWVSDVCPLHTPEVCPLFSSLSGLVRLRAAALAPAGEVLELGEDENGAVKQAGLSPDDSLVIVRERYIAAYRRGQLDPHILDTVRTGTMWPRLFLEDPDKECVLRSVGRPIRLWTYAILDAGVGLSGPLEPEPEPEGAGEGRKEDEDDDDALIDVEEDDSDENADEAMPDPLARLRGALKELDGSDDESGEDEGGNGSEAEGPSPSTLSKPAGPSNGYTKFITEYVRRGTRLAPEEISVPLFTDLLARVELEYPPDPQTPRALLPPQVWSDELRRTLFLRALASDYPTVAELDDEELLAVLAVRWVVRSMHLRAQESPGVKERLMERWTQAEARAFLASFSAEDEPPQGQASEKTGDDKKELGAVAAVERHIQLVAQVTAALDAIEQLSQVLLLSSTISSPARRFSGVRCHALLSGRSVFPAGDLAEDAWRACVEGLEDAYALPPAKKTRERKSKAAPAAAVQPGARAQKGGASRGGMFGLLADAEA